LRSSTADLFDGDAIEAYEARRWPLGKDPTVPGGKG
jgi:hypothetical protein